MVARLITTSNSGEQAESLLINETTTIGRKPNNDIHISDLSVSGKHAQIITKLENSFIEDLGSTNGTYVNGKLVKKQVLDHGDNITLGKYQLIYQSGSDGAKKNLEHTIIIRPDEADMLKEASGNKLDKSVQKNSNAVTPLEATNSEASLMANKEACLQLLSGANAGKELVLTKALTTIGQPGVQVAAITRRPQGFFLIHIDGGPNNAVPKVAGEAIGSSAYVLKNHSIIEVAGVKMEFYLR
jgi:pSer/pThr/pTyr-binding forkhead associated (FHA) protein